MEVSLMRILEGKIAVVTGAASGIGKAIAIGLSQEGATVCPVDKVLPEIAQSLNDPSSHRNLLAPIRVDLENDQDIHDFASGLSKQYQGIDILIHSAGIITLGEIAASSIESFDRQLRINARAPYLLTCLLLPHLKASKGQIVFINSSAGLRAKAGVAAYAASKHALKAIADALREEVGSEGLRVLSIYPGRTATPMQSGVFKAEGRHYIPENLLQPEDIAKTVIEAIKLSRSAEITDIHIRSAKKWD
jgi:NAD(P)-dependent dehydrogenase (short-subunit alcohol dehydrogenase family)